METQPVALVWKRRCSQNVGEMKGFAWNHLGFYGKQDGALVRIQGGEVGFEFVIPIDCENNCAIVDFESTGLQLLTVFINGAMSQGTELVRPLVTQLMKTHSEFSTWWMIDI